MARIINPTKSDLPKLARCHRAAFPKALSSAMGQRYVEKMLEWYLVDDRAFIFLLEEDGECIGYCGGLKFDGTSRVGSASSMIQHSYNLAVSTFFHRPWLFFHSEFLPKYALAWRNVVKRLRRVTGLKQTNTVIASTRLPESHAGLVVIGVKPGLQSRGYGSQLLKEFERISNKLGFKKMMLTVRTDNQQAIRSYLRNGWKTTKVDGKSTSMEKQLP